MKGATGPFDPSALERAAQALREINQSPHAHKALEAMIRTEEAKKAKSQEQLKAREVEKAKVEGEERRKNMEKQKEINQQIAENNDKLERVRWKDKLKDQEESQAKVRREQEESVKKQEEIRRETIAFQIKKQEESDAKKIQLKERLRAETYRKNFDLILKEKELQAQHDSATRQTLHRMYMDYFRGAADYLLTNRDAVWTVTKFTLGITGAYFLTKFGMGLSFRQLEALFNKPYLVRDTSRYSFKSVYKWPYHSMKNLFRNRAEDIFAQIVVNRPLEEQLKTLSFGMVNKKKHLAPLRNFLFYGPPGTGKTLFAKALAKNSGLHYALVSGGDIEKLGSQASVEIDKLFAWARSTPKGTILFVDEAESVFYQREKTQTSTTNALATLLAETSAPSSKISLILATNIPWQLDKAALDRMDQIVEFTLQEQEQRKTMLRRGIDNLCKPLPFLYKLMHPIKQPLIVDNQLTEDDLDYLAKELEGFSGRQIDKFIISLYDEVFASASNSLTLDIANKVLTQAKKDKSLRDHWTK